MDDFLQNLAETLNQPGLEIHLDQRLQELPNWDSLAILTTLSMLDQEFNVTLSDTELQSCNSVADPCAKVTEAQPDAS